MEKNCEISMQPSNSSKQIHAHLKKYSCSLENVFKNPVIPTKKIRKEKIKRLI